MVLLFFTFLDVKVNKEIITVRHFILLFVTVATSLIIYFVINPIDTEAAQAAFITAIGPTAIAAPVIIGLKRGKVEFVAVSLLLNNIFITLSIPFLLLLVTGNNGSEISISNVLVPVIVTLAVPFLLAQGTKLIVPKIWRFLVGWKDSTFYLLIINIYIATSDASDYIRHSTPDSYGSLFLIAGISGILCLTMFSLGWFIGGKKYAAESSQALGQKNNAFTIWIALTYMNPIAVIGPISYVLFQNIYVSYELYIHNKRERETVKV